MKVVLRCPDSLLGFREGSSALAFPGSPPPSSHSPDPRPTEAGACPVWCITTDSPLTPSQQCSRAGQACPSQSGASGGVAVSMQTRAPGALPECDSHAVLTLNTPQAAGCPEPLSRRPHFMPEGQLPSEPWGALAEVRQEAAMLTVEG